MPALTIGIIHHERLRTLRATISALQRDHDLRDVEILVCDTKRSKKARKWVRRQQGIRYVASSLRQPGNALDQVFELAHADVVVVLQDPVRLRKDALASLRDYFTNHPDSRNLVHGPLMRGNTVVSTHSDPYWRRNTWGSAARDARGGRADGEAFVVPMQESGVFSCRRDAWPGMPVLWRGYGGEAGFLQERFRRNGGQVVCLPGFRWERIAPLGSVRPRSPAAHHVLRNHLSGAADLGLDTLYITLRHRDHLASGDLDQHRHDVLLEQERQGAHHVPLVSCLLYAGHMVPARQALLEEAVESFLRQGYPEKELILLNDVAGQELVCEALGVRVVNTSARCPSLGDAFNAAVAFARGDLLAPWGATSINLPWRLAFSVAALGRQEAYRPAACWYMLDGELDGRPGRPDGGHVALMSREAFRAVGGFPSITLGLHRVMDAAVDQWLSERGQPQPDSAMAQGDWFTILRREQADAGYDGDPFLDPWQAQGQAPVKRGRFVLKPHWEADYVTLCRDWLPPGGGEATPTPVPVPFVLGAGRRGGKYRFPRLNQADDESADRHLEQVVALVDAAVAAGGTHLVIPRAQAGWLSDHAHVMEYLSTHHWLTDARAETGVIFALNDMTTNEE